MWGFASSVDKNTYFKKLRVYVNSQASVGSVYPPLRARDSLPGGYDSLCRRFGRGIKEKRNSPTMPQEKKKKEKPTKFFFVHWFVLLGEAAWFYPAARIHYRDL